MPLEPQKVKVEKKNEKVTKPGKRAALAMCKESGQTKSLDYDNMINFGRQESKYIWTFYDIGAKIRHFQIN